MNVDWDRKRPQNPASNDIRSRGRHVLFPSLLALVALAGIGFLVGVDAPTRNGIVRDADLCPIDADRIGGDVVILFDFTKPLDGVSAELTDELLRNVTLGLEPDAEIRTYLLTGSADAPVALLRRFCKPFDSDEIQVAQAKDQIGAVRDCDDLPAQVATDVRHSAARFCAMRESLQSRIKALVEKASQEPDVVSNAYLVEALEDIQIEFQERPGRHRLHIFSDMMQHARWYSHLDLDWTQWNYDEFLTLLANRGRMFGQRRYTPEVDVDIHYFPRVGRTIHREARERHQGFWRSYFAGASVEFHEQSPNPAYSSRSLKGSASESEPGLYAPSGMKRFVVSADRQRAVGDWAPQDTVALRERQAGTESPEQPTNVRRVAPRQLPQALSVQAPPEQQAERLIKVAAVPLLHEAVPKPPPQRTAGSPPGSGADVATSALTDDLTREQQGPSTAERKTEPLALGVVEEPPAAMPTTLLAEPGRPALYSSEDDSSDITGPGGSQAAAHDAASCQLQRRGGLDRWLPRYPLQGHRDFGDAVIAVRYTVDEAGETIDEETAVVRDESSAALPRHFDRFAREALKSVRNWKFSILEQDSRTCPVDISYVTAIRFKYE